MQVCLPAAAVAEIPALSREFRTERYIRSELDLGKMRERRYLDIHLSGGSFQVGENAGDGNPFGSWKRIAGGRAEVELTVGRFTAGADGVADTKRSVEFDAFKQRVHGTAYVPEARLSATGAVGFDDGYSGADVSLESLVFRPAVPSERMDLRPRIWAWLRWRTLDGVDDPILRPALGAFIQHAIVVGSQAYLGVTASSDLSNHVLPRTELLVQLGFATNPRPLWGVEDPGPLDPAPAPIARNLFGTLAYGAPLDARGVARLVVQAGIRLVTF